MQVARHQALGVEVSITSKSGIKQTGSKLGWLWNVYQHLCRLLHQGFEVLNDIVSVIQLPRSDSIPCLWYLSVAK